MAGPNDVSAREAEVLAALAGGRSNAQIARRLQISVRTVESHISSLLRKYGVSDRHELAALADTRSSGFSTPTGPGTTFVGRERDRAELMRALASNRLVSLLGPGGVGKTRLALQVAAEVADSYPYGGAVVDLVPVRPGFVVAAIAEALQVVERPPHSLNDAVLDRLRRGRTLLVLDNCEHLLDDVAALVGRVLTEATETAVLVTSRERLGVAGERPVQLGPLALGSEAEELFRDRGALVAPELVDDRELARRVCAELDGVPLAIELAAARAGSLGPDGLLAALDDRLRLLSGGRGPNERHNSLAQVIGWSYDLLAEDERRLFRRLGVFAGGFDLAAVAGVSPGSSWSELSDLLGRLTDKSLLRRGLYAGSSRWRMLETVRAFALEQLKGEYAEAATLHAAWAQGVAAALEQRLEAGDWQEEFDLLAPDLRAARGASHALARTLAHLTFARRRFLEAREHYLAAAELAGDPGERYEDLRDAADAAIVVADGEHAYHLMMRAAADGNPIALAYAVTILNRYEVTTSPASPATVPTDRGAALLTTVTPPTTPPGDGSVAGGGPGAYGGVGAAGGMGGGDELGRLGETGQPSGAGELGLVGRAAGAGDRVEAGVRVAWGWVERGELAAEVAVDAARRVGDPLYLMSALDAYGTALAVAGRLLEARATAEERLAIAETLPDHQPRTVAEIVDAFHTSSTTAVTVGDITEAVRLARLTEDPVYSHPYITAPRKVRAYALSGMLDEAVAAADVMWNGWRAAGCPQRVWMASAAAAAALAHGLLGTGQHEVWQARALELARVTDPADDPTLASAAAFVDARLAVHHHDTYLARGDAAATRRRGGGQQGRGVGAVAVDAGQVIERAFGAFTEPWWVAYARAAAAELAVVTAYPGAAQYLEQAASENAYAEALRQRAYARLTADRDDFERAAARFARIGARFEQQSTLRLAP
ncbi:LuxR C-terminal-related transcriptional regulator [Kribbella sp. NPDC048915]|uniref:ATP-binding protein n=1 Tax=Kribbella sp. NPDC048915 TaxID=3155148 RepID=UPI0033F3063B